MTDQKIAKLEHYVLKFGRRYLDDQGFYEMLPPRIVRASGACENIDTLFQVTVARHSRWFTPAGRPRQVYLAQTGQLYLEAYVPKLRKVYCVGPSFRAEPRVDDRHLTEFTLIEIEFAGGFDELLAYIESFLNAIVHGLLSLPTTELSSLGLQRRIPDLARCPLKFPKLTYDQAIKKLQTLGEKIVWGDDISSARERKLLTVYNNQPVFLVRFPDPQWHRRGKIEVEKFFNMIPDRANPGRVLSADLILPYGGEAVGAAARVHHPRELESRLKKSKMFRRLKQKGGSLDDFSWYLIHTKQKGSVPHAGCGFGLARIMQWLLGKTSILQSVTFPANRERVI